MDIKNVDVDFEGQAFEHLDVNPYELVIALSKKARTVNEKAQKYLSGETFVKPISITLKKLEDDDVSFEYITEEKKDRKVEAETAESE